MKRISKHKGLLMDLNRLSCIECGFKSDTLIEHIKMDHAGLQIKTKKTGKIFSGLEAYVRKYAITDENDLVHPDYVEAEEKETITKLKEVKVKKAPTAEDSIKILDVELPTSLASVGDAIPKEISYYNFGPHAKDVALDIIENKRVMLVGHTGCIAGDTIININRGGKGSSIKIEDAYKLFIGESRGNKKWDTRLQTKIRSFIEAEERIGLNNAIKFVQSGVKETFTLELEDGSMLRATSDHEVLTTRGFVALGQIKMGDEVICDRTVEREKKEKTRYKLIMCLKFHPYCDTVCGAAMNGGEYNRVPEHRAVVEASLSGLTTEEFVNRCRKGYDLDMLEFLDPSVYVVHHKDHDPLNNNLENLEVLTHEEHRKLHGKENAMNFGRGTPTPLTVSSVRLFGNEMTYDVVCEDPNRNFVANGMVIHNCGKTSVIEQIASRLGQSIARVNLNGQTTVGDFVGLYTARDGSTVWIDGALPRAMRMGHWLVLDEIDFAEPQILACLNSVLEPNGKLFLKEKGHEVVEPHPNFRIFATANTIGCMSDFRSLYQGANIMNEAFLDRWRCYFVDYMKADDEIKVIIGALPRYAKAESAVQIIVKVVNMVREAFIKEEVSCTFSTRRAIEWADLLLRYKDPVKAAEVAVFSKINKTDAEVIKGLILRVMVKK